MIDTIKVSICVELSEEQLGYWRHKRTDEVGADVWRRYIRNTQINGVAIKLTYFPPNPVFIDPSLQIELSLTKVLYRNNLSQITDISEIHAAAILANELLSTFPGIPRVDLREGQIQLIAICFNHQVGELVQDYLGVLWKWGHPNRKTGPYKDKGTYEGIRFRSKVITTSYYDKEKESRMPEAYGILRQEIEISKSYYIARLLGVTDPTLRDFTIEWATKILQQDLEKVHLDRQLVIDRELAYEILTKRYGLNSGNRLFGYLCSKQTLSSDQIINRGYSKHTIQRNNKMIADAGVSLALLDARASLPPLTIDLKATKNVAVS